MQMLRPIDGVAVAATEPHRRRNTCNHLRYTDSRTHRTRQCVRGCRARRSVISPSRLCRLASDTGVGRWRNHTKAQRPLFHRLPDAGSRAATKRGNKRPTGHGDGKAVSGCTAVMDPVPSRPLARSRGQRRSQTWRARVVFASLARQLQKSASMLRIATHRPRGRSTPPREGTVPRNFP